MRYLKNRMGQISEFSVNLTDKLAQKKRKCISLETKIEIIKKHCDQKITTTTLSKEYGVNTSTISTVLSSKAKILEHYEKYNTENIVLEKCKTKQSSITDFVKKA
ncbi:hypothetical protein BpHYR1_000081 [Brachionus plicatilis]|uniref:HTH psq-type domain-containing protein n=1 Tax=Brachionus plicatilis TaxID=10195 RepID=A0A3M7SNA8_BRAPC|nr:hypothetical protein BpHYR1_000081 [Brachionus plicatilis]